MFAGAAMLVTAVQAIEEEYGKGGVEVIHQAFRGKIIELVANIESDDNALRTFCSTIGTHG
jgi:hypothetical protein